MIEIIIISKSYSKVGYSKQMKRCDNGFFKKGFFATMHYSDDSGEATKKTTRHRRTALPIKQIYFKPLLCSKM